MRGGALGWRALSWAVGLFVLSQATLALLIPHDGFVVRDPIRHERLRMLRLRIAEAASPPKVVVLLGSSHIQDGLRSRQISLEVSASLGRPVVVANQGDSGAGPVRSLLAMGRLNREGIVPDLVLLETFPVLFDDSLCYDTSVEALPATWLDEGDKELLRRYAAHRTDLTEERYLDKVTPVYTHRSNLTNFFMPWLLSNARRRRAPDEEVIHENRSDERRHQALAHAKGEYYDRLQRLTHRNPLHLRAVDDLVASLRARGTRVIFLVTPEGPIFRSWYPPDRWARSVVWLREFAARHGVPLVNAREWTDREEMFLDSHHLSNEGAEQFSRWLGREVLVPQLEASR